MSEILFCIQTNEMHVMYLSLLWLTRFARGFSFASWFCLSLSSWDKYHVSAWACMVPKDSHLRCCSL